MNKKKRGFTLIEVLVVILIIGVLAAVALPQYQKAVMKSRYSALMPIAKSIANGNEAYYLEHGVYATSPASLDVAGQADYPDGTVLKVKPQNTTSDSEAYSYVIASRDHNFPLNYLVYQNHSPKFAGNIHCEADENNTMAQEVCQSLGGQYIDGSQTEGYLTYVLSGTQTVQDKLPSSLSKLAKTICANIAPEDCIIDDNSRTITTKTCSNAFVYTISPDGTSGGYNSNKGSCKSTHYDAEGNEIGKSVVSCSSGAVLNEDKTHCVLPSTIGGVYEERYILDDQGNYKKFSRYCQEIQDGQCVTSEGITRDYWPNSYLVKSENQRTCATGDLRDDGTCSAYTVMNGDRAGYLNATTEYDRQGHPVWYQACTHRSADGTCTSMDRGYINTYAADGTTHTGYIGVSCKVSHRYDTNPCTEYSLSYSGNASGPATCEASKLDFTTFECAS